VVYIKQNKNLTFVCTNGSLTDKSNSSDQWKK